jgi:dihydrofolate reductase
VIASVWVPNARPVQDPAVTFLTGDITAAVATARKAAGGKNLEILSADVTGQCLQRGLIDETLVHILPVLLGSGFPTLARIDLEPISNHTVRVGHHPPLPRPRPQISIMPTCP